MSRIEEIRKQVVLRRGNVPVESRESGLLCDLAELLAHIDAQAAQIEKLRAACETGALRCELHAKIIEGGLPQAAKSLRTIADDLQSALAATADGEARDA